MNKSEVHTNSDEIKDSETTEFLDEQLKILVELNAQLEECGGPENNGELFEKILSIEDEILENSKLLHSYVKPTEEEEICSGELKVKSIDFKTRDEKTLEEQWEDSHRFDEKMERSYREVMKNRGKY